MMLSCSSRFMKVTYKKPDQQRITCDESTELELKHMLLTINSTLQEIRQEKLQRFSSPEEKEKRQLEDSVPLYVITPTYPRMTELSEITRTGQVLKVQCSSFGN